MVLEEVKSTASPRELLSLDLERPLFRLENHSIWKMALTGEMSREKVAQLILLIYPVFAGPGRYLFSAKLSQISSEDGAMMFRQLYEANKKKEADADAGWRRVGLALDLKEQDFDITADCADTDETCMEGHPALDYGLMFGVTYPINDNMSASVGYYLGLVDYDDSAAYEGYVASEDDGYYNGPWNSIFATFGYSF